METDECETEVSMTSEHDAANPVTDDVTGVKESEQNELPDAEKMETDETESDKVPAELQETPDKAEAKQRTEEPFVLCEIVKPVDSSNAAPEVAVQEEAVGDVKPVETKTGDEEVENLKKMKWEDIEAMSVDFVANNIHHPVVSCYRELTKSDVHQILSQVIYAIINGCGEIDSVRGFKFWAEITRCVLSLMEMNWRKQLCASHLWIMLQPL